MTAIVIAALIVLWCGRRLMRDARADRERRSRRHALRAAIGVMEDELHAGARPDEALRAAADIAPHFAATLVRAAEQCHHGADVAVVLRGDRSLRDVGRAWDVALTAGAPLADVMARLAADLEAREELARQLRTTLTGPRSSAALVASLPLVGIALGSAMGARPLAVLADTHAGHGLLVLGVSLDAAGMLWTHRMARRVEAMRQSDLPLTLDLVAAALQSGRPVPDALVVATARGDPLRAIAQSLRTGMDAEQAWRPVIEHLDLAVVARVATRSSTSGARLASALQRLAHDLRREHAATVTGRAHRVGVFAAAPLGLCFLPAFVCLGIVPVVLGIARSLQLS